MKDSDWNIRNKGRRWRSGEAFQRWELIPEKPEMFDGKLYWTTKDRVNMLGLLLEQVGADRAVRLGDPEVWRKAVAKLQESPEGAQA